MKWLKNLFANLKTRTKSYEPVTDDEVVAAIKAVPTHYGAAKVSRVFNAANQEVTMYVAGLAKVGINIFSVTGSANVFSFFGSIDGVSWFPLSVAPYPAAQAAGMTVGGVAQTGNLPASAIQTASAAGTWEAEVSNLSFVRVQMTSGSGPASVVMAGALDGSYQEAFLTPSQIGISTAVVYPSTTSTASDTNTQTIPAQANRAINLTFCEISLVGLGFGGNGQVRIWDGSVGNGVPLFSDFLTGPVGSVGTVQKLNLPVDADGKIGIQASPGNAMVVQIRGLGTTSSIINSRVSFI